MTLIVLTGLLNSNPTQPMQMIAFILLLAMLKKKKKRQNYEWIG